MPKIVIIGATTWGTTLSIVLGNTSHNIQLLTRNKEEAVKIHNVRENVKLLPDFSILRGILFPDIWDFPAVKYTRNKRIKVPWLVRIKGRK